MRRDRGSRAAGFRYGAVFAVTFVLVVFQIAAAGAAIDRAIALGLEGIAFTVVVATSRERADIRRARALAVAGAGAAVAVLVGAGVLGPEPAFAIAGLLAMAISAALIAGVARLITERGVTLQAVLGALTIYLYVGLLFAWVVAVVSIVSGAQYFAQSRVEPGDRVYYSFTVLTTTGFGDFTPATALGHALAVVEMLIGQLYLVTVIGVLVGHLVGRPRGN